MVSFWHHDLLLNLALFTIIFPFLLILSSSASPPSRAPSPRLPILILSVKTYTALTRLLGQGAARLEEMEGGRSPTSTPLRRPKTELYSDSTALGLAKVDPSRLGDHQPNEFSGPLPQVTVLGSNKSKAD